jgi:hypothetical protein
MVSVLLLAIVIDVVGIPVIPRDDGVVTLVTHKEKPLSHFAS